MTAMSKLGGLFACFVKALFATSILYGCSQSKKAYFFLELVKLKKFFFSLKPLMLLFFKSELYHF